MDPYRNDQIITILIIFLFSAASLLQDPLIFFNVFLLSVDIYMFIMTCYLRVHAARLADLCIKSTRIRSQRAKISLSKFCSLAGSCSYSIAGEPPIGSVLRKTLSYWKPEQYFICKRAGLRFGIPKIWFVA